MGEVYKQAKRVLVYFGTDLSGDAADVSSLISEYARLIARYKTVHEMPILAANDPALNDRRWQALSRFHHLPWWSRTWVVQEVGLAKEPICLYGAEDFNYRDLMRLAVWTTRCAPHLELRHDVSFATVHTDWLDWSPNWRDTSPDPSQTFLSLMNHSRWLSCSERKDHVYALLGHPLAHVDSGETLILQPAYARTDEEVYLELGKRLIHDHGYRVLSPVDHDQETWKSNLVPSWVPFYHNTELTACNFGVFPDFWYNASNGLEVHVPPIVEGGVLLAKGFVVDVVERSLELSPAQSSSEAVPEGSLVTDLENEFPRLPDSNLIRALIEQHGRAYSAEDRMEALSLTLCAGLSRYRCAENDLGQHRKDFAAFYRLRRAIDGEVEMPKSIHDGQEEGEYERFLTDMKMVCEGRTVLSTAQGRYGLGPLTAAPGDICCVFTGATVPFILRKSNQGSEYKLMGEAYVHGVMRGEAVRQYIKKGSDEQTFIIS